MKKSWATTKNLLGKTPLDNFLKSNPLCAEAVFNSCIGTNGDEVNSKELLITFDLSPFILDGSFENKQVGGKNENEKVREKNESKEIDILSTMVTR